MLENKDDSPDDGGTLPSSGAGVSGSSSQEEEENQGTLILDAACAPVNIRYPPPRCLPFE